MKFRVFLTVLIVAVAMTICAQDDDPQTLWEIEERCIEDPTYPPDNWTYEGTILMSGYAGIHAMQADWETPHVEAFYRQISNTNYPIIGGQVSPDGQWYAVPMGYSWAEPSFNTYYAVVGVRIYNLLDETVIDMTMADYEGDFVFYVNAFSYFPVEWVDDESFFMGGIHFYPFENRTEDAFLNTQWLMRSIASPDFSRIPYSSLVGLLNLDRYNADAVHEVFFDFESSTGIVWKRDSSSFIAIRYVEGRADNLSMYDRDGNFIELVIDLNGNLVYFLDDNSARNETRWSLDDLYFAFSLKPNNDRPRLQILDANESIVIDTCLNLVSKPVWSPDGTQLAYLEQARENLNIVILDIETWQAYIVGEHSGISGAMSPNMLGWRSNN